MNTPKDKKRGIHTPPVSRLHDVTQNKDVVWVAVPKTDNRGLTQSKIDMIDFVSHNRLETILQAAGADPKQFDAAKLIEELPDKAGTLTNRTGWVNNQDQWCYLLYEPIVPMDKDRLLVLDKPENEPGIGIGQISGGLEDWQQHVAAPAITSKAVLFAVCSAFAGPLLRFSNLHETMVLNFSAKTSTGKSTMVKVAASVFGNPEEFPGWNLSETRMYEAASAYNDNTVIFDDIEATVGKLSKRMADAHEVIHAFTSGKPRGVSRIVSSAMVRERFYSIALSSSPSPILSSLADSRELEDSDRVRLLEITIPETQYGIWDPSIALDDSKPPLTRLDTDDLAQNALRFYGTAGRVWIRHISTFSDNLRSIVKDGTEAFVTRHLSNESKKNRIASKVGLIETAGVKAVEAELLPCSVDDVKNACDWAYKEIIKTAFGHEMALSDILDHINNKLDGELFPSYPQTDISSNASLKRLDGFINEDRSRLIMTERGFQHLFNDLLPSSTATRINMLAHIRMELIKVGIYLTDSKGHHISSVAIAGNGQRRWVIDLTRFDTVYDELAHKQPVKKTSSGRNSKRRRQKAVRSKKRNLVRTATSTSTTSQKSGRRAKKRGNKTTK